MKRVLSSLSLPLVLFHSFSYSLRFTISWLKRYVLHRRSHGQSIVEALSRLLRHFLRAELLIKARYRAFPFAYGLVSLAVSVFDKSSTGIGAMVFPTSTGNLLLQRQR